MRRLRANLLTSNEVQAWLNTQIVSASTVSNRNSSYTKTSLVRIGIGCSVLTTSATDLVPVTVESIDPLTSINYHPVIKLLGLPLPKEHALSAHGKTWMLSTKAWPFLTVELVGNFLRSYQHRTIDATPPAVERNLPYFFPNACYQELSAWLAADLITLSENSAGAPTLRDILYSQELGLPPGGALPNDLSFDL